MFKPLVENIRAKMRSEGIDQRLIADKTGIDPKTVSSIVEGASIRGHRSTTVRKFSKAIKAEVEDVFDLITRSGTQPGPTISPRVVQTVTEVRRKLAMIRNRAAAGHVEHALDLAFSDDFIVSYRDRLADIEMAHGRAVRQDAIQPGVSANADVCDSLEQLLLHLDRELGGLDDPELEQRYSSACQHNIPTHQLLPLHEDALSECMDTVTSNEARLVAIWGPQGVGKSSLAIQMGRRAAHLGHFDEILWVNLRGECSWREILATYKRQHPAYESRRRSCANQIDELIAHLTATDRRTLFILDNCEDDTARDIAQFVACLEGGRVSALITTTNKLVLGALRVSSDDRLQPIRNWDKCDFLTLVAWQCDRRRHLARVADGARLAYDRVRAGEESLISPARLEPERTREQAHWEYYAYELCDVVRFSPKLLQVALGQVDGSEGLDYLRRVIRTQMEDVAAATAKRWDRLTPSTQNLVSVLMPHDEGMTIDILGHLCAAAPKAFDAALELARDLSFVELSPTAPDHPPLAHMHSIELDALRTSTQLPYAWDGAKAFDVLRYLTTATSTQTIDPVQYNVRLTARAFQTLIDVGRTPEATGFLLVMTPRLKRLGLWEIARSVASDCSNALDCREHEHTIATLGLKILAWVAFWWHDYSACRKILESITPLRMTTLERVQLQMRIAHCLLYEHETDAAREMLLQLRDHDEISKNADVEVDYHQVFSQLELAEGNCSAAIAETRVTLQLISKWNGPADRDPDVVKERLVALYYQAESLRRAGRFEEAYEVARSAFNANPNLHIPSIGYECLCMAQSLQQLGRAEDAIRVERFSKRALDVFYQLGDRERCREARELLSSVRSGQSPDHQPLRSSDGEI